ncbi:MAG: hypothetical protein H6867_04005 [Rhodospirillales bacterium]|nr:hypothetical protein [Rhodospirillales bacterium]MCB9996314.1 hypothetical protein [Rhodospirillales bacterium]
MTEDVAEDRYVEEDSPKALWRSIGRWLEHPSSFFVDKYIQAGALNQSLILVTQMDVAYKTLTLSPSFMAMVRQFPDLEDTKVYFADLENVKKNAAGFYDPSDRKIMLDVSANVLHRRYGLLPHFVSDGAHEYRHAAQHCMERRNLDASAVDYDDPYAFTMRGFIKEADAYAFQGTVAYEIKALYGVDMFWDHFSAKKPFMAFAFERKVEKDPEALWDGTAQQAAMLEFFETESNLNYYADNYIDFLKKLQEKSPRAVAEDMWRHQQARKHFMKKMVFPHNALPKPGHVFAQAASPLTADDFAEQPTNGMMDFEVCDGEYRARDNYADEGAFPSDSIDFYFNRLGRKQYAGLMEMARKAKDFREQVEIELGKIKVWNAGSGPQF